MCGRFAASASTEDIVATFAIDEVVDATEPTFNAAPTDPVAAVVERVDKADDHVVRKLISPRWGLVPSWSKDARGGARMINARSETVATKPASSQPPQQPAQPQPAQPAKPAAPSLDDLEASVSAPAQTPAQQPAR